MTSQFSLTNNLHCTVSVLHIYWHFINFTVCVYEKNVLGEDEIE